MKKSIQEPATKTPVSAQCDVFIAGGGVAGIAAALAAARAGASVILAEKQCVLGGLATSGLVVIYLPLCDGNGTQISYGIAQELFNLSIKHGAQAKFPSAWFNIGESANRKNQRLEVQFNPIYFAIEAEKLLLKAGVKILYDTLICSVKLKNDYVDAVIIENQNGRTAVSAKAIVDATGSATIFQKASGKTRKHAKGNTVAGWYYASTNSGVKLTMLGFADATNGTQRDSGKALNSQRFWGDDADEISTYLALSHNATLNDATAKAKKGLIKEPAAMIHMPQYRMTRCICGTTCMKETSNGIAVEGSVGMVSDWRKNGPKFEVPFNALRSDTIKNMFAAGRCISVDDEMWDIMRSIPACAVTGQAAGAAAALCATGKLKIALLQQALRKEGQRLTFTELD